MDKINQHLILNSLRANFQFDCIRNGQLINIKHKEDINCFQLIDATELVTEIITSKPHFSKKETSTHSLPSELLIDKVSDKINQTTLLNYINAYFHTHKKHPYFTLLIDKLNNLDKDIPHFMNDKVNIIKFIEIIKKEAKSETIKQALYKLNASVKKNYNSLNNYVHQLMDIYPNLLINRLDLHYNFTGLFSPFVTGVSKYSKLKLKLITERRRPLLTPPSNASPAFVEYLKCIRVNYTLVQQHRKQFFKILKKQFFYCYLVGYAWNLDYNSQKGYFYQILLFFDKTFMDNELVKQLPSFIINFWQNTITHEEGYGSSIYIHPNNTKPILYQQSLEKAILALTVNSLYLHFIPPTPKDRTFDRGRIFTKKKATLKRQQAQLANYWHDL